jgi:hypothetical protein
MEIVNRITKIRNKLENESNLLFLMLNEDKSKLKDIIKLNVASSINIYNLKNKVDGFYKDLDVKISNNKINLKLDKEIIFYFSIFNNFEYIILLYLYINNNFNLAYTAKFNNILNYFEYNFSKIKKNIITLFLKFTNKNDKCLFYEITKYLDIPTLKKKDIKTIKNKFEEYENSIKKKIKTEKNSDPLKNIEKKNAIIEEISSLNNNIDLIKEDIEAINEYCDKKNLIINDLKKKITDQRITEDFEKRITKYNFDKKVYNELKEKKELLIERLKSYQIKLENIDESKGIKPKLKKKREIEKKIEILGEKPKLVILLNGVISEINLLNNRNSIDKEIINNNIEKINSDLYIINSKLSTEDNILEKKDNTSKKKLQLEIKEYDLKKEEKKNLERNLGKYNYKYVKLVNSLKDIENKNKKNTIKLISENRNYINELIILEKLRKDVDRYIEYLISIEREKEELLKIIEYDNLKNIIKKETSNLEIKEEIFKDLLDIFRWKMNIDIQIEVYLYMGFSKNNIINGINFEVNKYLKTKQKILFNNNINRTKFHNCFLELKKIKDDISEAKKLSLELDIIDEEVKILKKF